MIHDEEYGSTEEDNSSDDDSYTSNSTMTEGELIDALYVTCDWEKTGEVPASRLVEYVKYTTSNVGNGESDRDLQCLSYLLDPDGQDRCVTVAVYREIMMSWIQELKQRNDTGSEYEDVVTDSKLSDLREMASEVKSKTEGSSSSVSLSHDMDTVELQSRVADLQFQNKKLTEENSKLQYQLDTQEEALSNSTTEINVLQRKLKSLQEMVDLRQETLKENEELKAGIARLQERCEDLQTKLCTMEKDNTALKQENIDMEKQIQNLNGVTDSLRSKNQELTSFVTQYKHRMAQMTEVKSLQEYQLNKRFNEVNDLQNKVKSLNSTVQDLRKEKDDIHSQFTQSQLELYSLRTKAESFGIQGNSVCSDVEDDKEITPPQKMQAYFSCSTPINPSHSIGMELRSMLSGSRHLPSPLCEKEFTTDVEDEIIMPFSDDCDLDLDGKSDDAMSVSFKEDLTMEISKFVDKYKQKQNELLDEVDRFLNSPDERGNNDSVATFTDKLQEQMGKLSAKFTALAKAKDVADQKLKRMQLELEKLQGENKALRQAATDSSSLLMESDKDLENTTDNRLVALRDKILEERSKIRFLEKQLKDKDAALEKTSKESQEKTKNVAERILRTEIQKLKKLNQELTDKCQKAEAKVSCMREESSKNNQVLSDQKMKCEELEESLAAAMLARQLDLTDIWRLVQKDVEREVQEEQKKDSSQDIEVIKDRIAKEIEHLKAKLTRNQIQVKKKNSSRPEKLSIRKSCGCFGHRSGSDASSPLVEALNIDIINGNDSRKLHCSLCHGDDHISISSLEQHCSHCSGTGKINVVQNSGKDSNSLPGNHDLTVCAQGNSNSSSSSGILDCGTPNSVRSLVPRTCNKQQLAHHFWLDCDNESDKFCTTDAKTGTNSQNNLSFHSCDSNLDKVDFENNNKSLDADNLSLSLRRWSYEAAIACQNNQVGANYPRFRSGSFLAAVENGQSQYSTESYNAMEMLPHSAADIVAQEGNHTISRQDVPSGQATTMASALDFTVNSSYLTCTDSSHNHTYCDSIRDSCQSVRPGLSSAKQTSVSDMPTFSWRDPHTYQGYSMSSSSFSSSSSVEASFENSDSSNTTRKLSVLLEEEDGQDADPGACTGTHPPVQYPGITTDRRLNRHSTEKSKLSKDKTDSCVLGEQSAALVENFHGSLPVTGTVDLGQLSSVSSQSAGQQKPESGQIRTVIDEKGDNQLDDDVTRQTASLTSTLVSQLQRLTLEDQGPWKLDVHEDGQMEQEGSVSSMSPKPLTASLSRIRQDNIVKRREQMRFMRMPDLTETQESSGEKKQNTGDAKLVPPKIAMTNGDHSSDEGEDESKDDNPVLPSIPDAFLEKLGLAADQEPEVSTDQLTDQEIENKFTNLALAFKTDKITLEKRLEIQERSRDIAEENVAKEINGIRDAWEKLNQIVLDTQVREVLLKIQKHIDVLEQVTSRLSGRAEVFGAVQQERRMSKAVEIMLSHVENLRMVHEREHTELEEARKMIQDNRPFGGSSSLEIGDYGLKGRSHSVCQASALQPRVALTHQLSTVVTKVQGPRRRVSEVGVPRIVGGSGSLSHSASMDSFPDYKIPSTLHESPVFVEDPKSKFQQIVASTAVKNSIGNTMRRASLEKQGSSSSVASLSARSRENSVESKNGSSSARMVSQSSSEEEAYQKGFEQGIKAQIGGKLSSLREQQNSISEKLEEIQDKCEEDDSLPTINLRETIVKKLWEVVPEWNIASKRLRMTMAGFVFFMALCSIFLSLFPPSHAAVQVYPQYKHMDRPPV